VRSQAGKVTPLLSMVKILQIGNYPPPMCGWAIQTKLVTEELRRRGHTCEVLKINEDRQVKDSAYVDVQNGPDYLRKVVRYGTAGYRLNVHVNAMSPKGYLLAMVAVLVGRILARPALVTFHGGLSQDFFPRRDSWKLYHAFRLLFRLAGAVACDSAEIKHAIEGYGIPQSKVIAIATFSSQYLNFEATTIPYVAEEFLSRHRPVFFSYVSFRAEYRLETLREGMSLFREKHPQAGFVWLGFPGKELASAQKFVDAWPKQERDSLLLLGNLPHDQFLTLMTRCSAVLRTPACDGVAASVLEALALGVPVVASENGRRPAGVISYRDTSAEDMCDSLNYLIENYETVKASLAAAAPDDNVGQMADWLSGNWAPTVKSRITHDG
jgi:glycosyltransferase involved in cell wall biosynthesis